MNASTKRRDSFDSQMPVGSFGLFYVKSRVTYWQRRQVNKFLKA